jgi:acetylornithine/N-succinyldiaminopimelate aminotransferase
MCGIEIEGDGKGIYEECMKRGLLINCTQGNVLRMMPPLIVKEKEIDRAVQILDDVLADEVQRSFKEGSRST